MEIFSELRIILALFLKTPSSVHIPRLVLHNESVCNDIRLAFCIWIFIKDRHQIFTRNNWKLMLDFSWNCFSYVLSLSYNSGLPTPEFVVRLKKTYDRRKFNTHDPGAISISKHCNSSYTYRSNRENQSWKLSSSDTHLWRPTENNYHLHPCNWHRHQTDLDHSQSRCLPDKNFRWRTTYHPEGPGIWRVNYLNRELH